MKYSKYPKYKDGCLDYIGELPLDWGLHKLKWCISKIESGRREEGGGNQLDYGVFSLGGEHIDWEGKLNLSEPKYISEEFYSKLNTGKVHLSDVLLVKDGATIGKCAIVNTLPGGRAAINEHVYLMRANFRILPKFLYFFVVSQAGQIQIKLNIQGAAQGGLNSSFVDKVLVSIPPLKLQDEINNVLNKQTEKIDRLISLYKEMVGYLKEKRHALITRAVTKGLNPNMPMKDSGIEWIGKIPLQWTLDSIKHTSYVKGRVGWKGLTSDEYIDHGYAYLVTGQDFFSKHIDWESCYQIDKIRYDDDPYIQLKKGDLLLTKDGTIGKLAIVKNLTKPACLNSGIFLVRPINSYLSDFLYWVLSSEVFSSYYEFISIGSTIQHLYQHTFENFKFPIPSISEQITIIRYLERRISEIDLLIEKQQKMISLLNERKTSLISEAVTGKIDVRGLVKGVREPGR